MTRLLYLVVCGAGPAGYAGTAVDLAHGRGWEVQVIATPSSLPFLDEEALAVQTSRPIRSQYRKPGDPRSGSADAVLVAPATLNTICKLAAGISDTYALGVLNEIIGLRLPVVVMPFVNSALAARKPFGAAVELLRSEGVSVLLGPEAIEPHEPHTGGSLLASFPWKLGLDAIDEVIGA